MIHVKKLTILVMICFMSNWSNAQFNIGISSYYEIPTTKSHLKNFGDAKRRFTYNFGLIQQSRSVSYGINIQHSFSRLFVEVSTLYRREENTFSITDYRSEFRRPELFREENKFIILPINAGVKFDDFQIGVGPIFKFYLEGSQKINDREFFYKKERNLLMGFQYSISYTLLEKIKLSLRYETEFEDIGDLIYYRDENSKINSKIRRISLGTTIFI